jgi:aromatic ring-opening dioxygenase catalytic subunit (LigB family)
MIERMVESTSSSSNMHEDVDDNINRYRSMIMDTIKMNQDYTNICSILDEKQNADAARFFKHLKDYDDLLWVGCTNQSKLSVIVQVFTIQSDYGQSEAGYEKITEWVRSIFT